MKIVGLDVRRTKMGRMAAIKLKKFGQRMEKAGIERNFIIQFMLLR